MLTRLRIRNFKLFEDVDIELRSPVVLIGPNNSGKTTALQALALWEQGLRQWNVKRAGKDPSEKRPGVAINRLDLAQIPIPSARLLWRRKEVRKGRRVDGKAKTQNIRMDIIVDGVTEDIAWSCGLEFDYSNEESFVCRPLRQEGFEEKSVGDSTWTAIPPQASRVKIAYLPPMSGLAATEPKWEIGRINVLIGEGQTAQVLRNLCHHVYQLSPEHAEWHELCARIESLFGTRLLPPKHVPERGEVTMEYEEQKDTRLDLSCSGRGMLQTLLLLAHLYTNPQKVLLLDEPDAHLEILRQRETFRVITDLARAQGSQFIAATHSEVVLNEAVGRASVVSFVGKPHRMDDQKAQVIKALSDIAWEQYSQAEQTGWVLYLEGSTDLAILQAFAHTLQHEAEAHLNRPFVCYTTNLPQRAREHFYGLRHALPGLVGVAIFDRLEKELHQDAALVELMWSRREIENYFCRPSVLRAFVTHEQPSDMYTSKDTAIMERLIADSVPPAAMQDPNHLFWCNTKVTDDFLDPLFREFSRATGCPFIRKADYHVLARFVPPDQIDPEVIKKLDAIVEVAKRAAPQGA